MPSADGAIRKQGKIRRIQLAIYISWNSYESEMAISMPKTTTKAEDT